MNNSLEKETLNSNLVFVPYIWVVVGNGIIEETKSKQYLNLQTLKPGENITNFYGEVYPFYNLSGNEYTITDNGPISSDNMGKKDSIVKLTSQLVSLFKNVPIKDLHGSIHNEKSMYESIEETLKKYYIPILDNCSFSLTTYIDTRNALTYETSFLQPESKASYSALIRLFDAFLYREGYLKNHESIALVEKDDEDESYSIPYGSVVYTFNYFMKFASSMLDLKKYENSSNSHSMKP